MSKLFDARAAVLEYEAKQRLIEKEIELEKLKQQRKPLTLPQIAKALAEAGLKPEDYREDGLVEPLVRAIEDTHGIKGDA